LLARIEAFVPSSAGPCLECGWSDEDYALQDQRYACQPDENAPPPTNAPSSLGALSASLQAIDCHKLLAGQVDKAVVGEQVIIDAASHNHYRTRKTRNPLCRFDHEVWAIGHTKDDPSNVMVGDALNHGVPHTARDDSATLSVEGKAFVTATTCTACGHRREVLRLQGRLRASDRTCGRCGGEMVSVGFDMRDGLVARTLPPRVLRRSLASLGFRTGDVYSIATMRGEPMHYEIGSEPV
jgi:hypothetical protein